MSSLPPIKWHHKWDDPSTRRMFAYLKPRNIDPLHYDKTVIFWSQCITKYCEFTKSCIIDFTELRQKFRRDDLLPSPLETVMIEMCKKGELKTKEELTEKSWISWSLSFVRSNNINVKTQLLIHTPTIAKLARQLQNYHKELDEEYDGTHEIIGYNELRSKTQHIIKDELSFELVVQHLVKCGEILEGQSNNSKERVLKFKDQKSNSLDKFTEADASVHDIRCAMRSIESEILKLEDREVQLKESAKQAILDKNYTKAKNIILKKKLIEKEMDNKNSHFQQLSTMLAKIFESRQTAEILNAYKLGNETFKDVLDREGLTSDDIGKTIDSVRGNLDDFNKINEAISGDFIPQNQRINDEEIEKELNEMMEADYSVLPEVPSFELPSTSPIPSSQFANLTDSLELRMKRLRTQD
uniref:Charged multivesicular body protein 7 n=1 Tax=Panagrolaimus davidi TaxID=227884 RepID=A0A914PWB1_9BILA